MNDRRAIQSVFPRRVEQPQGLSGYCRAVQEIAKAGENIADYGVAHQGLGHAPPGGHMQIVAPTEGFEHWVADLSARVPGGMTLGELRRRLGEKQQFLPLDGEEEMTVAEIIAHNVSGPLRLTHGTCKELLLGLRYVDATGTLITVGGRTVKNVAGYDVTRMMVGNLNTLGLIADANLRTAAVPPQVTQMELRGVEPAAFDLLVTDLLTCDALPLYLETRWSAATGHAVHLGYAGTPLGCEAQARALGDWVARVKLGRDGLERGDTDLAGDSAARADRRAWRRNTAAHVKLIVPPARTGEILNTLRSLDPLPNHLDALPAHGILHAGGEWSVDQACRMDQTLEKILNPLGGLRLWLRRPEDTPRITPFAPAQPDWAMLQKIKSTMDPHNLFNPGRFP